MSGPEPGVLLAGRYRLMAVIGRGGMGEVWRATDELLHREVAVKTLGGWAARTPATGERFRREALAVAQLNQRRVAAVFDYVESDGVAFIVMELLDGENLAERLQREGVLPPADAAEIVAQAAEGLQAAHNAGITHRDVKPANIMLTVHGVKLLDFGLAATTWENGLTSTGMMVGTLAYLSPERAAGEPATEAGDIYALGVVCYEALVGRKPFSADNPLALVNAHASDTTPALPAGTPPHLAAACLRALAKNPADRFSSAGAFAAAVRGHSGPAPVGGPMSGQTERLTPGAGAPTQVAAPSRRRLGRRPVLLGVLAVAVLVVALVFWAGGGELPGAGPDTPSTEQAGKAGDKSDKKGEKKGHHKRGPVAEAFHTLLSDIAGGVKSGDIRPEAAQDAKPVKELRKQIAKSHSTKDLDAQLDDIDKRIDDRAKDGTITPELADTLHADVKAIASAAGENP
jgi:eukaryotic-like serine/threonine-protein kinase